ncbi:uncharacterized protein I206_106354 [Kwoniella pini CBS 10737]|uniref:Uncharacterized protein n=1 Tax=Kwoniella pini CBS 10737 TaxID=1296096 RepID=A0A1B9HU25_9TREE|nr:uncharacterized protein I206_07156 [Kwoniella pini CBS 10737]OCF46769.1 hypothetical protein I206_07156 [Kwoniella pini CBS 10737]
MSTPNQGNSASPAPQNLGYPFIANQQAGGMNYLPPNQQQQFMPNMDMSTSSPIPGASGGQGDPGPSSMAQQQQGQFRPQFQQQGGITPQQMAMLQQFSQAAQSQGGQQRQLTPQQVQMAMTAMQAQQQGGGSMNPQALMAAMRATQQNQGMQGQMSQQGQMNMQGQQQQPRPPNQQMNNFGGNQTQQPGQQTPNSAQMAYQQQQRIQQMMQARPNPGSPIRPHQQQQPNSMPPPPVPNSSQQPQQQQQQQSGNYIQQHNPGPSPQIASSPQGGFHLSQEQRDFLTQQRNNLYANPQFLAMPPQQQQAIMVNQQQQLIRTMTAGQIPQQSQQSNQQQQRQSQQGIPQPPTPSGRPSSSHGTPGPSQSPIIPRQPTPQQMGTPQAQQVHTPQSSHIQTPQQPLSSLPQHMAPPRPASAASQRAPSPHHGVSGIPNSPVVMQPTNTPPPSNGMFPSGNQQMGNASSPTPSNVSHHSQHQTPAPHHIQPPPHSVSPVHGRSQTPIQPQQVNTPQSAQSMNQVGMNGQYQPNQQFQMQPHQQVMATPQQGPQSFSQEYSGQARSSASPAQQGSYPVQPIVPNLQNMTAAQQQQMASAMSFMSQAAQAQQGSAPNTAQQQQQPQPQQQVRPLQQQGQARPPSMQMPNINTSDFPFDPRLLPLIQHVSDEKWRTAMMAQNPQMVVAAQQAAQILPTLRHDVIQRMQNVLYHTAKLQAAQGIRPQMPGQIQSDQSIPAFSPTNNQQISTPGAIPPNQQQRIWQAQQAAQGSPVSVNGASPAMRPPPPHLPPVSNMPGSPSTQRNALDRRSSQSNNKDVSVKSEKTPQQASMPPPAFIPSHTAPSTAGPSKAPDTSVPPSQPGSVALATKATPQSLPVKEWQNALRLDLPITNISALPINEIEEGEDPTFNGSLPPLSEWEKSNIQGWLEKDKKFVGYERENQAKRILKMKKWAEENDKATPWWMLRKGEARTKPTQRLRILWPTDKEKDRANRTHRGRKQIKFTPAQFKSMAEVEDQLVPVRLDLEHDNFRLKDTFMWNCSDKVVTPELFAQSLCDDFQVPPQHFFSRIVATIQERVKEYQDQVLPIIQRHPREEQRGKLDPEGDANQRAMYEIFRKIREGSGIGQEEEEIKTDPGEINDDVRIVSFDQNGPGSGFEDGAEETVPVEPLNDSEGRKPEIIDDEQVIKPEIVEEDRPMTVEEVMQLLPKEQTEELRILIKIDIIIGTQNLSDSFEWDLNSTVTPEEFSASYVTELGLSKEFATALAHDIHEQILVHNRSLFLVGHAFGSGLILDDEVRLAFLPPVTTSLRKEDLAMSSYTPIFNELAEDQLALVEAQREKESKRKKRTGRARRGVILPDRDPVKTQRSLLNPLGANGLPVFSAPELIAKDSLGGLTSRRRGAAIAAEANMALIAQDLPITGPSSPAHNHTHHHGPTISARGKRIGRPPKNAQRDLPRAGASPANFPGYDSQPGAGGLLTPQLHHGIKRSFREDSMDDLSTATGSPAISRKRANHSRIPDSPSQEPDTPVKQDFATLSHNGVTHIPYQNELTAIKEEKKPWHCRNCGVPEHLSGGPRKDKNGQKVLCGNCSRYLVRTGKDRPCDYTTDEAYHLEISRRLSLSQSQSQIRADSTTPTLVSPNKQPDQKLLNEPSSESSESSSSDDDDDDEDESDSTFASSGKSKKGPGRGRSRKSQSTITSSQVQVQAQQPQETPRNVSSTSQHSPNIAISPTSGKKVHVEMPVWASRALAEMRSKYPRDDFTVLQKPRPADIVGPIEWRAKCMDCPGRIYSLGPGETLLNFEVHLKNRAHIQNRLNREGKTH